MQQPSAGARQLQPTHTQTHTPAQNYGIVEEKRMGRDEEQHRQRQQHDGEGIRSWRKTVTAATTTSTMMTMTTGSEIEKERMRVHWQERAAACRWMITGSKY